MILEKAFLKHRATDHNEKKMANWTKLKVLCLSKTLLRE